MARTTVAKRPRRSKEAPEAVELADADLVEPEPQGSLFWVQGQLSDGSWRSLYCYSREREAKAVMRAILDMDEESQVFGREELGAFEDFRVRFA